MNHIYLIDTINADSSFVGYVISRHVCLKDALDAQKRKAIDKRHNGMAVCRSKREVKKTYFMNRRDFQPIGWNEFQQLFGEAEN